MALGCEVVNLCGLTLVHNLDDAHRVAEISIVEVEIGLAFQMSDTLTVVY